MKKLIIIITMLLAGCSSTELSSRTAYSGFASVCSSDSFTYVSTTDGEYSYFTAKCKVIKK